MYTGLFWYIRQKRPICMSKETCICKSLQDLQKPLLQPCLTNTWVSFDIYINLFECIHRHLVMSAEISFDVYIGLFWRIYRSLLHLCRFILHTYIRTYRRCCLTYIGSFWRVYRSLLTYIQVSFDVYTGLFCIYVGFFCTPIRTDRSCCLTYLYGVATMSRMLKNTGLFAEYRSLL